jgi:FkbM family methyltransferase
MLDVERLMKPGRVTTVVDAGANEGQTSLLLARRFSDARIYSLEPLSSTFHKLKGNTARCPNVHCENCALGSEDRTIDLYPQKVSMHNSLLPELNRPELSIGPAEKVRVRTLDEILVAQSINNLSLLKTDTEGFDLEVLRGGVGALKAARIDVIVSEVGFHRHLCRHTNILDLQDFLAAYDYELYSIYDQNHDRGRLDYADALFVSGKIRETCSREYGFTFVRHVQ